VGGDNGLLVVREGEGEGGDGEGRAERNRSNEILVSFGRYVHRDSSSEILKLTGEEDLLRS